MTTTRELRRERRIAADPTSLALLLAGPTGVDLWPGARRCGDLHGLVLVETDLSATDDEPARVLVRADAPRRTPAAFVLSFGWEPHDGSPVAGAAGTLALGYEGAHDTRAELSLVLGDAADDERISLVEGMAQGFLDNLAAAGEARARAA